ncbi:CD109 antigen-like isoform X10 [Hermetia illucens]|uniref:CD109 antigen-like isoform X10 n=1 Tax=Hermetia illucens TaxID=343691 RepID=UPI0018CC2208|nr:CD109 antigen-like isoform X10 [Hermetia illucens]
MQTLLCIFVIFGLCPYVLKMDPSVTKEVLASAIPSEPIKNYYTVTAPGTIRSNTPYNVSVTTHNSDKPIKCKIDITGPDYTDSQTVEVEPHTTQIVQFNVPKIPSDDNEYKIKVEGSGGAEFKEESVLRVAKKYNSVLIQTDKALYKPGDLVRYRVLVLDSATRPAKITSPIDIQITDGKQNIIKQLKNIQLTTGVFSDEIQLSELPVLGKWKINVDIDGETRDKEFGVEEYVLPKFEVIVDAEKHAYFEDGKIRATIRAKYTYGKPVKGTAEVTVAPKHSYMFASGAAIQGETKKTVPIDGKAPVEFELLFDRKNDWDKQMTVTAVVEEKLTGNKQNGSADVTVHRDKYEIRGEDISYTFEPGKPVTFKVKVIQKDGTPVRDSKQPLKVSISRGYNEPNTNETEHQLDENGEAAFSLTFPDIEFVSLIGKYGNVESHFAHLRKHTEVLNPPRPFFPPHDEQTPLKAQIKTDKPSLDKDVEVEVTSSKELDHISYQIIGKGNILKSDIIKDLPDKKRHTFTVKPTIEMVPNAHLYIQSIKDGELLWSETIMDLGENLKNQIKIETAEEVKPGEDVNIKVKTSPNSFVGLLGVDQSVLLLKQGNDLSKNDIFSELRSYEGYTHYSRYGSPGNQAGVVTFTNANYTLPPLLRKKKKAKFSKPDAFEQQEMMPVLRKGVIKKVNSTEVHIRHNFMQVWLWDVIYTKRANGELVIQKKVPDTITSWVITGFSLDAENGIGLTDEATKLKVFQPFFVSTNLPYSVKRGEVIAIPVIVFNYLNKSLEVDVVMENPHDEFDFTEATNEIIDNPKHDLKRSKHTTVAPQSGESLSFMIRPKTVGHISIKLVATSPLAGDAVLKMLQVDPEGVTEFVNKAVLIDLRDATEQKEELKVEVPENAVPNSTHIEATVVGDLLGPTIKNLDSLVRKPYGCGEQNMVNFVPNILVMRYLENIGKLTPEIADKARKFMEIGYQRELTYKHDDGSYSAFGKSDKSGSTWLTAYVARSFRQAANYIAIDENIIKSALEFLAKHQAENGSFPEVGRVIDHDHATENDNGVVLTAFTVLAFLENAKKYPEYNSNVEKALKFIDKNTDASGEVYGLAIAAYAMNVAKTPSSEAFIEKLEKRATTDVGRKWWAKPEPQEDKTKTNFWFWKPRSANVETTAYGLLTYLESGRVAESLPILKWLIGQRNSNGGFESTQDTVVGLSALIKFAEKFSAKDPAMTIEFNYDGEKSTANVDKDNAIVLQSYELPPTVRKVDVNAKGNGIALVQLSCRYNVDNTDSSPGFKVEPSVDPESNSDFLKLKVCASYSAPDGQPKESNMAVMEVNLPSGFTVDQDGLADIEGTESVKKVETKNGETVAVIYFDSLTSESVCPVVKAFKTHRVAQLKPAAVVVYDYYDDTRRAREFYSPPESSLCDICEGEECGTGCLKKEKN